DDERHAGGNDLVELIGKDLGGERWRGRCAPDARRCSHAPPRVRSLSTSDTERERRVREGRRLTAHLGLVHARRSSTSRIVTPQKSRDNLLSCWTFSKE